MSRVIPGKPAIDASFPSLHVGIVVVGVAGLADAVPAKVILIGIGNRHAVVDAVGYAVGDVVSLGDRGFGGVRGVAVLVARRAVLVVRGAVGVVRGSVSVTCGSVLVVRRSVGVARGSVLMLGGAVLVLGGSTLVAGRAASQQDFEGYNGSNANGSTDVGRCANVCSNAGERMPPCRV